ncbi:MAG: ABC transporter ATP-binding protein [Candidatus Nitrotoga sp.]
MTASKSKSLLQVRDLKVAYGGIQALKGIDLDVAPGELVALIGSNGAGKTTTLKALAGLLQPFAGNIHYCGKSLPHYAAHQRIQEGLVLVPEGRGVFARLTVEENLKMGAYCRIDKPSIAQDMQQIYQLFPRLAERQMQLAGTLSGGEQQMMALGRALMSRPKLLMLDEPSMGLAPMMVVKIFETIHNICAQGVSILLVEQNAKLALEVAHRGYVLESGLITLSDSAANLLGSAVVRRAYLGS